MSMSVRELRDSSFKSVANTGNDSIFVDRTVAVTSSTGPVAIGTEVAVFGVNAEIVSETFSIQVVASGAGIFTATFENCASLSGRDYPFVNFAFTDAGALIPVEGQISADGTVEITGSAAGAVTYLCTISRST